MANKVKCTCGHSWSKSDSSKKDMYICHLCGKDTRSEVPKAQVGEKFGKTEDEVRAAILKKAEEVFSSGKKPYKVPDEISQGSYLTGRKVCIQGVCGILSDAGFIPEDYYTNTKFAEKANEFGFGNPLTDINRLKPGDVFQHFTEKNEQGNYYPTHGEIFKGWNEEGEAEFYDYYDYYNYPLGKSEGIRKYSKEDLVERLKRKENKDASGKQAQFFSIAGNFPTKKSFPYTLPENELQQYFDKTHASDVTYFAPQSNIPDTSPLYYLSGEDVRQDTKNTLVDSFNDKALDSELKKNLKITDQDLQKIKPLIYGMVGQETQFNNPRSLLGNLKYSIENQAQLEGTSLGPGQIKLKSISKDIRKKFNINKNKDLLDPKNTYVALVDILSKAADVTDKKVNAETHPELVDKNRFERALYFVNSPGKIRKTDKQLSEEVIENAPWWSNFSERKMESNIRKSKNAPLRMDATSYPGKVVSKADTLEKSINFEDVGVLPEVMVTATKKKKNGGWLDKYDVPKAQNGIEGTMGGLTDKGFNYNGAWGGPSMQDGGIMKAQFGDLVPVAQPLIDLGISAANKVASLFSSSDDGKSEPKPKPKQETSYTLPETIKIKDPRKIRKTTGQPINPNVDLVSGEYNTRLIDEAIRQAKEFGLSKEDAWNLAAIGFQETGWGKTDGNIGHILDGIGGGDTENEFVNAYLNKMREADRLKITNPEMRLQVYNGLGVIRPETEQNYHKFKMKKIYGVPVPEKGISMKKNPLYGKQVIDIRENVLKQNPEVVNYIESLYGEGDAPKKAMGGSIPGATGMMYKRTGAPSKGPRRNQTDVTDASAKNGEEIRAVSDNTSVKKPLIKLSPEEIQRQKLKDYANKASKKEQPTVGTRSSTPEKVRKTLREEAKKAELKNQLLKGADVATDIMQVGNFIPNPIAYSIGQAGNVLGGLVDSYQAYDAFNKGNYGEAAINVASVALPMALGSNTFRRNSKYLQPGQPLYPFSPQAGILPGGYSRTKYIEPFTKVRGMTNSNLLANRALLGTLGAETVYDSYQNGGEMKFYQEGLDWKPRNISRDGSVIKDDRGQWAHPGEITEINSNKITMQGVPYDVIGVSDEGDVKRMKPGRDYKFKGKKVTEYPVKKWLEKYK